MERAIQILAVIHMVTMGISHIVRPRVWVDFLVRLRERGEPGVFTVGFLSLGFGSLVVAFHNVWQGIPLLLTVYGWLAVVKGLLYFVIPSLGMKGLGKVSHERANHFVFAGVGLLALAAALGYHLLSTR